VDADSQKGRGGLAAGEGRGIEAADDREPPAPQHLRGQEVRQAGGQDGQRKVTGGDGGQVEVAGDEGAGGGFDLGDLGGGQDMQPLAGREVAGPPGGGAFDRSRRRRRHRPSGRHVRNRLK
jgi:hypothetical protein